MAIKFGRPIESRDTPPRADVSAPATALHLTTRLRRNRKTEWARRLVRENTLTTNDLIWPLFVADGHNKREAVASMPGVERLSVDQCVRDAERAMKLDIPCIALFPYTEAALRDPSGSEALNIDNLVCRTVRAFKKEFPDLGVVCDVALDPFTSHGHDGLLRDDGVIMNDETVAVLEPYVTVLPASPVPVNLNTASAEVIYAALDSISMADAQRLVGERERQHFRLPADAARLLNTDPNNFPTNFVTTASRFFEVRGRLRLDKTIIEERSVVQRDGLDVKVIQRERGVVDPTALTRAALNAAQR